VSHQGFAGGVAGLASWLWTVVAVVIGVVLAVVVAIVAVHSQDPSHFASVTKPLIQYNGN
jgi:ABC-type arginine/histidine transport system permease subunit